MSSQPWERLQSRRVQSSGVGSSILGIYAAAIWAPPHWMVMGGRMPTMQTNDVPRVCYFVPRKHCCLRSGFQLSPTYTSDLVHRPQQQLPHLIVLPLRPHCHEQLDRARLAEVEADRVLLRQVGDRQEPLPSPERDANERT